VPLNYAKDIQRSESRPRLVHPVGSLFSTSEQSFASRTSLGAPSPVPGPPALPQRFLDNRLGMDENGMQTWTLYEPATSDAIVDFNGSGSLTMR
jgi:hypothetical protein